MKANRNSLAKRPWTSVLVQGPIFRPAAAAYFGVAVSTYYELIAAASCRLSSSFLIVAAQAVSPRSGWMLQSQHVPPAWRANEARRFQPSVTPSELHDEKDRLSISGLHAMSSTHA